MAKLLHGIALAMLLGGCGNRDGPEASSSDRGQPPSGASTDAKRNPGAMMHTMPVDPETRYGIVKTPLSGRAFNVRDFGSAPEGNAASVIRGLEPLARAKRQGVLRNLSENLAMHAPHGTERRSAILVGCEK